MIPLIIYYPTVLSNSFAYLFWYDACIGTNKIFLNNEYL